VLQCLHVLTTLLSDEDVEQDIETISSYISYNPPETSGELLKLRELQRKYREIAASIKNEIAKLG
jgi:hypothetical protein